MTKPLEFKVNKNFKYTRSEATDLRAKFKQIRREMEKANKKPVVENVVLIKGSK